MLYRSKSSFTSNSNIDSYPYILKYCREFSINHVAQINANTPNSIVLYHFLEIALIPLLIAFTAFVNSSMLSPQKSK